MPKSLDLLTQYLSGLWWHSQTWQPLGEGLWPLFAGVTLSFCSPRRQCWSGVKKSFLCLCCDGVMRRGACQQTPFTDRHNTVCLPLANVFNNKHLFSRQIAVARTRLFFVSATPTSPSSSEGLNDSKEIITCTTQLGEMLVESARGGYGDNTALPDLFSFTYNSHI